MGLILQKIKPYIVWIGLAAIIGWLIWRRYGSKIISTIGRFRHGMSSDGGHSGNDGGAGRITGNIGNLRDIYADVKRELDEGERELGRGQETASGIEKTNERFRALIQCLRDRDTGGDQTREPKSVD